MGFVLPPSVARTAPICCNAKGLHSWLPLLNTIDFFLPPAVLLLSAAMQKGFIVGYPLLNAMNFILLSAAVVLWCQNHSSSNKANPNRCFKFISTVFQMPDFFSVQKHFAPAQMFLNEQEKYCKNIQFSQTGRICSAFNNFALKRHHSRDIFVCWNIRYLHIEAVGFFEWDDSIPAGWWLIVV